MGGWNASGDGHGKFFGFLAYKEQSHNNLHGVILFSWKPTRLGSQRLVATATATATATTGEQLSGVSFSEMDSRKYLFSSFTWN